MPSPRSSDHRRAALVIEFTTDPRPDRMVACVVKLLEKLETKEAENSDASK